MKSFVLPLLVSVVSVAIGSGLTGCSKDPPKKVDDGPKASTPVPSDMVFNDFVPPSGSGAGIVGVKTDGGLLEGGMASAGQPAPEPGAAEPPGEAGANLKVTEPGAEPRAAHKYAYVVGRTDHRVITITQAAGREGGPMQQGVFVVTADFTPKSAKPTATHFEVKVLKVEIPGVPAAQKAQAAAQLAPFAGLTGQFDVTPRGDVGEVEFKADDRLTGQNAEAVLQAVQQSLDLIAAPLPSEPIGVGAKWERKIERNEGGLANASKQSFTLKELSADGAVITADIEITVPKHAFQQRGVPPGATQEVKGKGSSTFALKFDHVATKVDSDLQILQKVELADPRSGQKQQDVSVMRMKNHLEPAGGAAAVPAPAPAPAAKP